MNSAKRDQGSWKERRPSRLSPALRLIGAARGSVAEEVRSFCPFCGSSTGSAEDPCCREWQGTSHLEPARESISSRFREVCRTGLRSVTGLRLAPASNLLVALLASSFVAAGFSVATQWRLAIEQETELETAKLFRRELAAAVREAELRVEAAEREAAQARAAEA
ncbi:MAG: hypothetical protein ACREQQ_00710, partial [Candidatus Binatia bacterium]